MVVFIVALKVRRSGPELCENGAAERHLLMVAGGVFLKIQWKNLITCLAIPLAAGSLFLLLTRGNVEIFASMNKPPLTPPGWLFPVVWTILYIVMAVNPQNSH